MLTTLDGYADSFRVGKPSKANLFFLLGSILYLPPSILDVIWAKEESNESLNKDNEYSYIYSSNAAGDDDDDDPMYYTVLVVVATISYLINGILDMRDAYKETTTRQKQQQEVPNINLEFKYHFPSNRHSI